MAISPYSTPKQKNYQKTWILQKNSVSLPSVMLVRQECIDRIKANEDYITSQFEVKSLRLFGSLARNQQRESSDVDICVEMPPDMFQLIGLKQYLEELLGCDVDVIRMHRNIDNFLLNQIEKDGIYIIREPAHRMAYA